ncbi:hypothetical protein Nepgr_016282 [Nepenthes gracilis]|uniref:Uncharacterized protein n=1 Tax=Nepenthes gracilis TaxID=150966 RepID=A0AAD3SQ16_NEPGR|nr:hypothetical protein Nepgr_016282 [Nepenthes gracilis]
MTGVAILLDLLRKNPNYQATKTVRSFGSFSAKVAVSSSAASAAAICPLELQGWPLHDVLASWEYRKGKIHALVSPIGKLFEGINMSVISVNVGFFPVKVSDMTSVPGDISTVQFFKSQSDVKKALQQQIQKKFRKKYPRHLPISRMIYKSNHNLVYLDPVKLALKAIFLIMFEATLF